MKKNQSEIIIISLIIFLTFFITTTITMYLSFNNYFPSKSNTGKIIKNQVRVIGEVAIDDSTTQYWFAIPVDTDGDGYENLFVLDHAQTKLFMKGMPNKVTFQMVNRSHVRKLMPYLYLPERAALAIPTNYEN